MLTPLQDHEPVAWISETRPPIELDLLKWNGNFVSHCIPDMFPAYCKVFHPIYEDPKIVDHTISWNDASEMPPPNDVDSVNRLLSSSTTVYGDDFDEDGLVRIRWKDLAERYSLLYHPGLTVETFTRNFPGRSWPRYLIGPDEGFLDDESTREIVRTIGLTTTDYDLSQDCYFYYWFLATNDWESDLLFEGKLIDLFEVSGLDSVRGTPTYWWPKDRTWFVCSDYDLTFTLIGGNDSFVDSLVSNPRIECVRVEATTRIDNLGDHLNS